MRGCHSATVVVAGAAVVGLAKTAAAAPDQQLGSMALVGNSSQPNCSFYAGLTNATSDYVAVDGSRYDGQYEYVFNICRQIDYVADNGKCPEGTGMCELDRSTGEALEVYGYYNTMEWGTDQMGVRYIHMTGPECGEDGADAASARVYLVCDYDAESPEVWVVNEDLYTCAVYVGIRSKIACEGPRPPPTTRPTAHPTASPTVPGSGKGRMNRDPTGTAGEIGLLALGVLLVLALLYMVVGFTARHMRGVRGIARVPHGSFLITIPGLVRDGFQSVRAKDSQKMQGDSVDNPAFSETMPLLSSERANSEQHLVQAPSESGAAPEDVEEPADRSADGDDDGDDDGDNDETYTDV